METDPRLIPPKKTKTNRTHNPRRMRVFGEKYFKIERFLSRDEDTLFQKTANDTQSIPYK